MLRGDAHRFYLKLRRRCPKPCGPLTPLDQIREIRSYYAQMEPGERQLLLAWAKKEESGIGLIPAALSGVPLIGLIFAPFIQGSVRLMAPWVWLALWLVGAVAFIAGVYIHHRQKAYTTLHIQILEQLCNTPPTERAEGPYQGFPLVQEAGTMQDNPPAH